MDLQVKAGEGDAVSTCLMVCGGGKSGNRKERTGGKGTGQWTHLLSLFVAGTTVPQRGPAAMCVAVRSCVDGTRQKACGPVQ